MSDVSLFLSLAEFFSCMLFDGCNAVGRTLVATGARLRLSIHGHFGLFGAFAVSRLFVVYVSVDSSSLASTICAKTEFILVFFLLYMLCGCRVLSPWPMCRGSR